MVEKTINELSLNTELFIDLPTPSFTVARELDVLARRRGVVAFFSISFPTFTWIKRITSVLEKLLMA